MEKKKRARRFETNAKLFIVFVTTLLITLIGLGVYVCFNPITTYLVAVIGIGIFLLLLLILDGFIGIADSEKDSISTLELFVIFYFVVNFSSLIVSQI